MSWSFPLRKLWVFSLTANKSRPTLRKIYYVHLININILSLIMDRWIKRLISVLQIGGGFFGFTLILQGFTSNELTPMFVILNVVFSLVFLFGIIAGFALIENKKLGVLLSQIYQGIQILMISSPIIVYTFSSGFMVGVSCMGANIGAFFRLGSHYYFYLFQDAPWGIGVNFVALFFFLYLKKKRNHKAKPDNSSDLNKTTNSTHMQTD